MLQEAFLRLDMEKDEVDRHMAVVGTNNLVEANKLDQGSMGIIIRVVEYEVNSYAGNVLLLLIMQNELPSFSCFIMFKLTTCLSFAF